MSEPLSFAFRLALFAVPRAWRDMVRDDLADQFLEVRFGGARGALHALAIAASLHWTFTGGAFVSDLRDAFRALSRAKGFALGAIATFALGIGVNLAVFSAVDQMLFKSLPFADADRLVVMGIVPGGAKQTYGTVPPDEVVRVRRSPLFTGIAALNWRPDMYRLTPTGDDARTLVFPRVSFSTLATLGVRPVLGRGFTEDDAHPRKPVVMLRASVWRHDFGGRSDVVGRRLWSDDPGTVGEIIGVLPDDFFPPQPVNATLDWSGLSIDVTTSTGPRPGDPSPPPVLRLAPGVTVQAAQAFISTVEAEHNAHTPNGTTPGAKLTLRPLRVALFGRYDVYLIGTFTAATLVLLVACANLASLLLVRARSREVRSALQLALGASPWRIVRAGVLEALVLSLAGSVVAVALLSVLEHAIATWLPAIFTAHAASIFEPRVIGVTFLLSFGSAVAAGVLPGWRSARLDLLSVLQRGSSRAGIGRLRGSATILAAEVAVSLVLVLCAALVGRNLVRLTSVPPGYNPNGLTWVAVLLPKVSDVAAGERQSQDVLERLRTLPNVAAVAAADSMPMMGELGSGMGDPQGHGLRVAVSAGFSEAMQTPLLAGRTISGQDIVANAPVGVLSESGVRLLFPGVSPREALGRQLRLKDDVPRELVGVVADMRWSLHAEPNPLLYVPSSATKLGSFSYQVRLTPGASMTPKEIEARLRADGFQPRVVNVERMEKRVASDLVNQRFHSELLSGFGLVALALSVIGLYAVGTFGVTQRTTEFGLRLSLGATSQDLYGMLLKQAAGPALLGVGGGLLISLWLARYLNELLETIDARDAGTYAAVAIGMLVVTIAATLIPARRASRIDPAIALRAQ